MTDLSAIVVEELEPFEAHVTVVGQEYPHIEERLRAIWGTPECCAYLHTLALSDRLNRAGFPPHIFRHLMELQTLHPVQLSNVDAWGIG